MRGTFQHNFTMFLDCECCGGQFETSIEGRYYSDGNYIIENVTNLFSKKVFNPSQEQGSEILEYATDQYPDVLSEYGEVEKERNYEATHER